MIEKIRKELAFKYTVIIACILFFGFAASYTAYRHHGLGLMQDSLFDYLTEELWEAGEATRKGVREPTIHKINSDIMSLHNFTFWFVDKKVIHAERPKNDFIAERLEQRLARKNYQPGKIYHENVKHNKQKWYFTVIKEDFETVSGQKGEVFVLSNYTPVRRSTKAYVKISLAAAIFTILFAYVIGNIFAKRSMKYVEQSYQKQRQFVSDAAHELRTPLTILYSYMELLEYSSDKQKIIRDIKDELLQMNNLVDRLLAIARYDNGTAVIKHKDRFLINELAASAVASMAAVCPAAEFVLRGGKKDIEIEAGRVMMQQLFLILLDNAVKYTRADKKIGVELEQRDALLRIRVKDNGIGIRQEELAHVFDRFWQAEKSRSQKGLGLGLSLADLIVKMHGGTINVQSEFGHGTVFEVVLPLKQK